MSLSTSMAEFTRLWPSSWREFEQTPWVDERSLMIYVLYTGYTVLTGYLRRKLEGCDVLFLEEPLLSEHPEGIKQLSNLTSSPIALGERLYSRWDFKRFFEGESSTALSCA